jgi:transposase
LCRDNQDVASRLRVSIATAGKWRKRFLENRVEGLADEPRPSAPRTITDAMVEKVVTKTLEEKPKAATHWSTRGMAQAVGMSQRV